MAPQQPTRPPTPASGVQVVTLTVFSTGSAGSTSVPASSRGGSSVPIAAIAGGAAAGVTLAVAMVLIWKYWGLVIKRTERRKRKEAVCVLILHSVPPHPFSICLYYYYYYYYYFLLSVFYIVKCDRG